MHLLLWMMDEAGEVGDVIRKQGLEEPEVRRHFVEEMCDVMMYFNDLMNCFGISSDELAEQYRAIGVMVRSEGSRQRPPAHRAEHRHVKRIFSKNNAPLFF